MRARKKRLLRAIARPKMDSRGVPGSLRLGLLLLMATLLGTSNSHGGATTAKHGSAALCATIGPHVVAADAVLAPAAQIAVALGTDDTEVLSGTRARYGGAFKLVEDEQKLLPTFFHAGMNEVTEGQIAINSITISDEVTFATNTLDSYGNGLNAVEEFGSFALLYERSVNSKNRRNRMVVMSQAFAALGDYSNSTTTMNATCFGSSCYGTARTSTYQSSSGAANLQAAAIGASAAAGQQASLDQATPAMIDLTQKIDNYQYGYRRLRSFWMSACPTLDFPDRWSGPGANEARASAPSPTSAATLTPAPTSTLTEASNPVSKSFTSSDNDSIRIARTYGENASYYQRLHPTYNWTVISRYSNDYANHSTGAFDPALGGEPQSLYPIREVCYCTSPGPGLYSGYFYEVHLDTHRTFLIVGNKALEGRYGLRPNPP
jgi:hypothetical protein